MVGVVVYGIESQRVDEDISGSIDRQLEEFSAIQENGLDPETGAPFTDVRTMLETFLGRNVPNDCDVMIGWVGDGPGPYAHGSGVGDPLTTLFEDQVFLDAAARVVATGRSETIDSTEGRLLVAAQPVAQGTTSGALVVVTYVDLERQALRDTMRTYLLVSLLSLVLLTALAAWQSGRLLAPLRTLRETADEISETDLSRRIPETGHDDITALTRTVNNMLDRLEAAFVGQRQFLDDAGHELRTPLTILRGHLELMDSADESEVAEVRELLLDEVDRMSRLVGDLTLLAKSVRPDFLSPAETDLARLTSTVLAKSRGLAERQWRLDDTDAATVVVDEQRLTQALLQLADNAVKHTGPDDEIAIGSSYDGSAVRLWVRDTGHGVPPGDRELIFRRFGRSTVSAGDEGFGLGLSIVAAIADAHGGTLHHADTLAGGATFVITLPVGEEP